VKRPLRSTSRRGRSDSHAAGTDRRAGSVKVCGWRRRTRRSPAAARTRRRSGRDRRHRDDHRGVRVERGPGRGPEPDSKNARITVKVGGEHTGDTYEVFEVDAPRGPAVPPHAEPWAKSFSVLHSRITVYVDGELHDLGPGAAISIPAGAVNTFTVHTAPTRCLPVSLTGGMGRYFRDVDQSPANRIPEVALRRGIELVRR
jgi:quercetin dioxygenase-like cupin family protein